MIFNQQEILSMGFQWNFQWIHDPAIDSVVKILKNHPWRFVGGCVRDGLLGKTTYDIDINTPLSPTVIMDLFQGFPMNVIGRDHGTIMIFVEPFKVEITTLRKDVTTDGRRAVVEFTDDWMEDSNRRDFTINGLMMDSQGKIYDYHHGLQDLKRGMVKFIGNGTQRIQEDYLRILRFIRFAIRFNQDMEPQLKTMVPLVTGLKNVSMERIINEITLMVSHDNWQKAVQALKYLAVDQLIGGNFNQDFSKYQGDSIEQRWAGILLINGNKFHQWSLDGHWKKQLRASDYDCNHLGANEIFTIYNNQLFSFKIFKTKNLIINGPLEIINQLETFVNDPLVAQQYKTNKAIILNQYQGAAIGPQLINCLYNLWNQYINN
jgi:tRNA nucleotidyltransferase/poly(A) polymerase